MDTEKKDTSQNPFEEWMKIHKEMEESEFCDCGDVCPKCGKKKIPSTPIYPTYPYIPYPPYSPTYPGYGYPIWYVDTTNVIYQ